MNISDYVARARYCRRMAAKNKGWPELAIGWKFRASEYMHKARILQARKYRAAHATLVNDYVSACNTMYRQMVEIKQHKAHITNLQSDIDGITEAYWRSRRLNEKHGY